MRVLHPGFQDVDAAQRDGVAARFGGDLVHQHLGRGHRLQRAVAAHRPGGDVDRGAHLAFQVAFREVIDRLRRRYRDRSDRGAEVHHPAAVADHLAGEALEHTVRIDRDRHVRLERVALQRELEMLPAVQHQPHRIALRVKPGNRDVIGEGLVFLLPVADRVAGHEIQLVQREPAGLHHRQQMFGDCIGRLGGADDVQRTGRGVVPGKAVFRLHRRGIDRLGRVMAGKDLHAGRRCRELGVQLGRMPPRLAEHGVVVIGPLDVPVGFLGPDDVILHRRELVRAARVGTGDPHELRPAI